MGDQELIPSNQVPVNIEDEMRSSYLDYAMSVIIGRALPEVRDGLKPVHRRILYAMYSEGITSGKRYTKCAGVVGEVIKKYHPHGDAAVYDALVRMAQEFNMRYPLIDGQGNFGSVDGDPPAAYRYTECRLARLAEDLLADIEKETVDFSPNFDESTEEPDVLPTRVPNLLINGSDGIAVGMATKIPPHNLTEIINATILLIQKPQATLDDVLELVPGPDFPTGAYLYGRSGIKSAYATGRGQFTMRAKAAIERPNKNDQQIVITEIPFQVNKANLIKRIAALVQEKRIEGISDVRDESDRDGMRIVVELKRGEQPEVILNNLYKHTQLQETFGMILLAIVNKQPRTLSLIEAIQLFIEHRVTVVRRRTTYDLRKARQREHVLEGLCVALDNLDRVIAIIRLSKSKANARENLLTWSQHNITDQGWLEYPETGAAIVQQEMIRLAGVDANLKKNQRGQITHYRFGYFWSPNRGLASGRDGLSPAQVDAILELQLHRLTQLSTDEILTELGEIKESIKSYEEILASDKVLKKVIVDELKQVQKDFGDARRTQIIEEQAEIKLEDLITMEDVVITVSHSGYVKRTPLATYRQQGRGGKGRLGMRTREEDIVDHLFIASTHSYILVFTNTGKLYWLKVYEIPDVGAAGKGKHILNLVNLAKEEKVAAVLAVKELPEERKEVGVDGHSYAAEGYVVLATRKGLIKKTRLAEFSNPSSRGILAMKIEEGDELIGAKLTSGRDIVFLATHEGMAIRFLEQDVRDMGRAAYGVYAMDLEEGDYIVGMEIVGEKELILSVTEKGYGKRTAITEYRLQARAGKGVINLKATERNGKVVGVLSVTEESEVLLISQQGKITRLDSSTIRECGRSTQGVRLINLEEGDQVAAICLVRAEANGDDNGGTEPTQRTLIQ
ncbi:MAG TPA: DNA gyrase subunit A [Terriglobia bacterium]|nr:DNA gyrase subunit A [Terriglobia bacterium]